MNKYLSSIDKEIDEKIMLAEELKESSPAISELLFKSAIKEREILNEVKEKVNSKLCLT